MSIYCLPAATRLATKFATEKLTGSEFKMPLKFPRLNLKIGKSSDYATLLFTIIRSSIVLCNGEPLRFPTRLLTATILGLFIRVIISLAEYNFIEIPQS